MNHELLNNYDVLAGILKKNVVLIMLMISGVVIWLNGVFDVVG
jgi:hypothetical protein